MTRVSLPSRTSTTPSSPPMERETIWCGFTQTFPICWFWMPLSNGHVVTFFCVLASPVIRRNKRQRQHRKLDKNEKGKDALTQLDSIVHRRCNESIAGRAPRTRHLYHISHFVFHLPYSTFMRTKRDVRRYPCVGYPRCPQSCPHSPRYIR